ncbi:MAG: ATP/GTP-binding protein [Candidatus Heimdallarchaeota archaeon]|nr:ATP/GTP-binding protein [Candidatus Heimdallarchaeota archaeon]
MSIMNIGYMIGPAGSGKSHMTGALYDWMNLSEFDVAILNLDPGVVRLPYAPDIDVRSIFTLDEIVDDYELGPNGGLIAAMDKLTIEFDQIAGEIDEISPDYLLVDLPGQMEIFAYRNSGPLIMNELSRGNQIGGLFLIDPTLAHSGSSFISILLLGLSITYRLNSGLNYAITKSDLLSENQKTRIHDWSSDLEFLYQDLYQERSVLNSDLSRGIAEVIFQQGMFGEFPLLSAKTNDNLDIALGMLERIWATEDVAL